MPIKEEEDDFWLVAYMQQPTMSTNERRSNYEDENDGLLTIQSITILPDTADLDSDESIQTPLTSLSLKLYSNNDDGILSDVAFSIWDASLLLAGYLYGSHKGRELCYNACFKGCGLLELGSGMGISGMAAMAAAISVHTMKGQQYAKDIDTKGNSVVLTDRNNEEVLAHLRKNVDANFDRIAEVVVSCNNLSVSVEPCDWMDVSASLQTNSNIFTNEGKMSSFPRGPFSLILGSALVYLPQHAAACADTIFYYLTNGTYSHNKQHEKRRAILLQLPDRSGFTTHFLPHCHKLGLSISCHELESGLIERVQRGLKGRKIPSASDYRLYFITYDEDDIKKS